MVPPANSHQMRQSLGKPEALDPDTPAPASLPPERRGSPHQWQRPRRSPLRRRSAALERRRPVLRCAVACRCFLLPGAAPLMCAPPLPVQTAVRNVRLNITIDQHARVQVSETRTAVSSLVTPCSKQTTEPEPRCRDALAAIWILRSRMCGRNTAPLTCCGASRPGRRRLLQGRPAAVARCSVQAAAPAPVRPRPAAGSRRRHRRCFHRHHRCRLRHIAAASDDETCSDCADKSALEPAISQCRWQLPENRSQRTAVTNTDVTSHGAKYMKRSSPPVSVPGFAEPSPGDTTAAASSCTCAMPLLAAWSLGAAA